MTRLSLVAGAVVIAMTASANAAETVTTPTGLKYQDEVVGTGPQPKAGQQVTVQYTGWLDENGKKGKKFDSSLDRKQPYVFVLGEGKVIKGWDEGILKSAQAPAHWGPPFAATLGRSCGYR